MIILQMCNTIFFCQNFCGIFYKIENHFVFLCKSNTEAKMKSTSNYDVFTNTCKENNWDIGCDIDNFYSRCSLIDFDKVEQLRKEREAPSTEPILNLHYGTYVRDMIYTMIKNDWWFKWDEEDEIGDYFCLCDGNVMEIVKYFEVEKKAALETQYEKKEEASEEAIERLYGLWEGPYQESDGEESDGEESDDEESDDEENDDEENDEPITTCIGCIQGQPNQLAHMDPGGCLYTEEDMDDVREQLQF